MHLIVLDVLKLYLNDIIQQYPFNPSLFIQFMLQMFVHMSIWFYKDLVHMRWLPDRKPVWEDTMIGTIIPTMNTFQSVSFTNCCHEQPWHDLSWVMVHTHLSFIRYPPVGEAGKECIHTGGKQLTKLPVKIVQRASISYVMNIYT